MNALTQSRWPMDQNKFRIDFHGRPVFFMCKTCQRVNVPSPTEVALDVWEEASIVCDRYEVTPEQPWWFHTVCDLCQHWGRS